MRIPWEERKARMEEWKQEEMRIKNEKPRFALRLARFFIGEDYHEEVIPAVIINFFGVAAIVINAAAIVVMLAAAALALYLCWRYPLLLAVLPFWLLAAVLPVARLMYLNDSDQMLVHQGVTNPRAERIFTWTALACLAIALACGIYAHYSKWELYVPAAVMAGFYLFITATVFEFPFLRWMEQLDGNSQTLKDKILQPLRWLGYEIVLRIGVLVLAAHAACSKEEKGSEYE